MTGPFVLVPVVGESGAPTEAINVSRVVAIRQAYRLGDPTPIAEQCFVILDGADPLSVTLSPERLSTVFNEAVAEYAEKVAALRHPQIAVPTDRLYNVWGDQR